VQNIAPSYIVTSHMEMNTVKHSEVVVTLASLKAEPLNRATNRKIRNFYSGNQWAG
jgi:hypothetical protein